jgi:hypothetical protein
VVPFLLDISLYLRTAFQTTRRISTRIIH